jgi:hypothetical protein
LAAALGTTAPDLLPETGTADSLPVLREQAAKLTETLKEADRETLTMIVSLLARTLESPTRRRWGPLPATSQPRTSLIPGAPRPCRIGTFRRTLTSAPEPASRWPRFEDNQGGVRTRIHQCPGDG